MVKKGTSIQEAKKRMSKEDELAAKTRQQVDNAICWLEKRYFTEEQEQRSGSTNLRRTL
jgi:hypothetical protein